MFEWSLYLGRVKRKILGILSLSLSALEVFVTELNQKFTTSASLAPRVGVTLSVLEFQVFTVVFSISLVYQRFKLGFLSVQQALLFAELYLVFLKQNLAWPGVF